MNTTHIVTVIKNASIVTIAGLTILAGTPTLVQAAPMPLPNTVANAVARAVAINPIRLTPEIRALQREFAHEQRWLTGQQHAIDEENKVGDKTQTWIDTLKSQGKDTAALDTAMVTFHTQMSQTQTIHDKAATVLSVHAGFDANGLVVALPAARLTVRDAGKALESARLLRLKARRDLARAIAKWRSANAVTTAAPVEAAAPNTAEGEDR